LFGVNPLKANRAARVSDDAEYGTRTGVTSVQL
jgi:hypothetical protein